MTDAYYCRECVKLGKDRDGCPKVVNLGSTKTDLFYERKKVRMDEGGRVVGSFGGRMVDGVMRSFLSLTNLFFFFLSSPNGTVRIQKEIAMAYPSSFYWWCVHWAPLFNTCAL